LSTEENNMARLDPCSDCGHMCSKTAEWCPSCGAVFEHREPLVIDRRGWPMTIASGAILAAIISALVSGVLMFLFFVYIASQTHR
jgi:hypothetical protein